MLPKEAPQRRDRHDDSNSNNNNNNNKKNMQQPSITGFFKPAIHYNNVPCKYFTGAPGSCKDGSNCKYLHSDHLSAGLGNSPHQQQQQQQQNNNNARNNNNNNNNQEKRTTVNNSPVADNNIAQVKVPWHSSYTVYCPFTNQQRPFWDVIKNILSEPVESIDECCSLIANCALLGPGKRYATGRHTKEPSYDGLRAAIDRMPQENPKKQESFTAVFLKRILPKMIKYALLAPRAFPNGIPLLTANCSVENNKLVFTQIQVSVLLCVGFFGMYPMRARNSTGNKNNNAPPGLNLTPLYNSMASNSIAKVQCLLAYFNTISEETVARERERGVPCFFDVEFIRTVLPDGRKSLINMFKSKNRLSQISVSDDGVIETQDGKLQADFANLSIGGGVLHHGCVQEEIRFVISAELLVSRLFVEDLTDVEAVVMSGSLRYSDYTGYGSTFQYTNRLFPLAQPSPAEVQRKIFDVAVVAFDAVDFSEVGVDMQYRFDWVSRELVKAYAAFTPVAGSKAPSANCYAMMKSSNNKNNNGNDDMSMMMNGNGNGNNNNNQQQQKREPEGTGWIATGNWGCGVFGGDLELKFILQLIACSTLNRPMQYLTFSKPEFSESICAIYELMDEKKMTVTQLISILTAFVQDHEAVQDEYQRQREEADDADSVPNPYHVQSANENNKNSVDVDTDDSNDTVAYDGEEGNDPEVEIISPTSATNNTKKVPKLPKSLFKFIVSEIKRLSCAQ